MRKIITVVFVMVALFAFSSVAIASDITCWFPAGWKTKGKMARDITTALSGKSGFTIKPRIARNYPEILKAFDSKKPTLVYVGSFVQAIIAARDLGTPLAQSINGKELYSGIMVYPKGQDPKAILKDYPDEIAFAIGASSGESSAKAATHGKANFGVSNHGAAAGAVRAGKAKAAVVKNWWWEAHKDKFPMLESYRIPGVTIEKNPDNVLTANKEVPFITRVKITKAAIASKDSFGAKEMVPFDMTRIEFPLELMEKGKIDPLTYSWK